MKFNYQARTKAGEIQTGTIDASSKEAALTLLQGYGFYVTALEKAQPPFYARELKLFQRASAKDVMRFTRQLSLMFQSKVPLVEALEVLARQDPKLDFKEKILKISERIEGGAPLSEALSSYPNLFSLFYIGMVKSGETSGKLGEVLVYLAEHLEREHNFFSKIRGAMTYPAFVLVVFIVVMIIITTFVVPSIAKTLEATGIELPLITKETIAFSAFFKKGWWIIGLVFFALAAFVYRYLKTLKGRKFFDGLILSIPWLGSFLKKVYLSRLAETLASLISAGLHIIKALEVTGDTINNYPYRSLILETREGVRRGERMSVIFGQHPALVSPFFIQMLIVGERAGRLEESLRNIVTFYRDEVNRSIEKFLSLLEPIFIVVLGTFVGGIMISVFLPLYQLGAL